MLYQLYELNHAAVMPFRAAANFNQFLLANPLNPLAYTPFGKITSAACEIFTSLTRRYDKPKFGIDQVTIKGQPIPVREEIAYQLPFGQLKHFKRDPQLIPSKYEDPRVLLVAPMSGHYATLLRGTVRALLNEHDVYVTDWRDARKAPLDLGTFDLDDYIDYIVQFLRFLGPNTHVIAVCQPGPAVLAATALMAADDDPCQPASMTLMGSPIDSRRSPTVPNQLATSKPLEWFENNVTMRVPFPHAGCMRKVYPGFLQLTGFMTMNLDRHIDAHKRLFYHMIEGDGDSVSDHHKFYDEYLAVMDLTAEFYLQTLDVIFQRHALANGEMTHRGRLVEPAAIEKTALMTVEGEKDDISGIGQTQAAHDLCVNIPAAKQVDYIQADVGHYGVFNGSRWRNEIVPRIRDFIRSNRTLGA